MAQREIKFRAWDRVEQKMHTDGITISEDGKVCLWREGATEPDVDAEAVLMQYTGLKDRNGVEIYEGDIVRGSEPWETGPCVVEYSGSGFCKNGQIGDAIRSVPLQDGNAYFDVIGNVHENPELLEQ